ncbi:efflux RND transporter periplasmic adaptor subunit [Rhodalgimonas zhirmunskyi]|uniref:Efflux RND transporter periplasmic adaptor subunit n=1 Tax=Rhodalgimonas zhirmunskyi TaxID=2964767 RepID=A0AAJ1X589_9RHOB|nr:efflux RND transporter periplasmic adaptor subunit [Rhodoalgimonas zhirmunskyi]MDQ2093309.1 efflux RND transporter periplasmic adaptor subunit [Rhodoalgimonas zhirmunskyi]
MRIFPIATAVLVTIFLYFLVVERDRLLDWARGEDAAQAGAPPAERPTPEEEKAAAMAMGATSPVGVIAIHSTAQTIDSAVILRGETQAARQVDVRAETSGLVISEPLRKGAFVEQGEILCKLDPGTRQASLDEMRARLNEAKARVPEAEAAIPTAEAQLETAKAQLEEAQINDNAARKLSQGGYASDTRVASAAAAVRAAEAAVKAAEAGLTSTSSGVLNVQAAIQSAEAAVAAAQTEINRLEITAPFEGLLESDTAELGALMQPGGLCATVIQLDPIKLVGYVPETEVDRIDVGSPGGGRLANGDTLRGRVNFLSRSADPVTRTFRVEIEVPNPALSVRDGQTVEIAIASDGALAHLVPQSALTLNDEGVLGVRLVGEGDVAVFAPVSLMRDTDKGVWVTDLPEQADIIVVGQEYVIEGVPVRPSFDTADMPGLPAAGADASNAEATQ